MSRPGRGWVIALGGSAAGRSARAGASMRGTGFARKMWGAGRSMGAGPRGAARSSWICRARLSACSASRRAGWRKGCRCGSKDAGRSIRERGFSSSRRGRRSSGAGRPTAGRTIAGAARSGRSASGRLPGLSRSALSLSGRPRSASIRDLSGFASRGRISPASSLGSRGRTASRMGDTGRTSRGFRSCASRRGSRDRSGRSPALSASGLPGRGRSSGVPSSGIGREGMRTGRTRGGSPGRPALSSRGILGLTETGIGSIGAMSPGWRGTRYCSGRRPRRG